MDLLKVEKNGKVVENSVEWISVERNEVETEAFGLRVY